MRIKLLLIFYLMLCGCAPTTDPVAQASLERASAPTCSKAFAAIAPEHAIPNTDAAYAAASYACQYARVESRALSVCEASFPVHSLLRDPVQAADYRLRKRTLSALMDAELYGEGLAKSMEADRIANGGAPKSEAACHLLFDEFPIALTQREGALRALAVTGGF